MPIDIITFEPKAHQYFNQNGEEYISVTTLLGREFPFDTKRVANKVRKIPSSKYHGMSEERILRLWEDSSEHGNVVHEAVEEYIKEDIIPSDPSLVPLIDQFKKLNFDGDLLSEVLVWDEDYRLAGTADILEIFDDHIYLFDIKTSNRITDNKLMKFSLQLELYRRMIEKRFGKEARLGAILYFEDYVVKRSKTKLKVISPLHLSDVVDEILEKRKREITCQ